ncbi:MAG: rhodanese-like domain-containing protein [Deltaproteobacteria bacterium]|nr:rhodanese-like domain-containing protein [Deltaproteobacteria bacterium]
MEEKEAVTSFFRLYGHLAMSFSLLFAGCSTAKTHISQSELLSMMESDSAPAIVDVRSKMEYESGHIPKAIHVPFWLAYYLKKRIPTGPEEPILLYCEHGPRAGVAKFGLTLAGFKKIFYLEGHMTSWKKAKLPMEK